MVLGEWVQSKFWINFVIYTFYPSVLIMVLRSAFRLWRKIPWTDIRKAATRPLHWSACDRWLARKAISCKTCLYRNVSTDSSQVIPVFMRAERFSERTAALTQHGRYTYEDLLHYSAALATEFNAIEQRVKTGEPNYDSDSRFPLTGKRVAYLCDNDLSYLVTKWAIWMCGAIAVPLCKSHPVSELKYFIKDSGAELLVGSDQYRDLLEPMSRDLNITFKMITMDDYSGDYDDDCSHWETDSGRQLRHNLEGLLTNDTYRNRKAQIVYTSGTTGSPKVGFNRFSLSQNPADCRLGFIRIKNFAVFSQFIALVFHFLHAAEHVHRK